MPKMKTHRSAQKRYKVTGTGKITRGRSGRSHLNVTFSSSRKRRLDSCVVVDEGAEKKLALQLPYRKYCR
ncbi:MAG: 50S ribosomal protein L35 [Vampirovibrionales bacterium]